MPSASIISNQQVFHLPVIILKSLSVLRCLRSECCSSASCLHNRTGSQNIRASFPCRRAVMVPVLQEGSWSALHLPSFCNAPQWLCHLWTFLKCLQKGFWTFGCSYSGASHIYLPSFSLQGTVFRLNYTALWSYNIWQFRIGLFGSLVPQSAFSLPILHVLRIRQKGPLCGEGPSSLPFSWPN